MFTYSALINACVRGGDVARAWGFLEEMRAAGIAPNEVTWTTLIKAYCDIGTAFPHRSGAQPLSLSLHFSSHSFALAHFSSHCLPRSLLLPCSHVT